MSAVAPLRQVRVSNPAACRSANSVGDQPPRSNPTSTRRSSPTVGAARGSAAQLGGQGSGRFGHHHQQRIPGGPHTQLSTVAGAGNFNRGTRVFAIPRVPW